MKNILLLYFIIFSVFLSKSQKIDLYFDEINNKIGLPSNNVTCFYQDSQGFMWIGTISGLCRYDGRKLLTFQHSPLDSTSIPNDYITAITESSSKYLWVGTNQGLCCFDREKMKFIPYQNRKLKIDLRFEPIRNFVIDKQKTLWVQANAVLYAIDTKTDNITIYKHDPNNKNSLPFDGGSVWKVLKSNNDGIWVTCKKGTYKLNADRKTFTHYPDYFILFFSNNEIFAKSSTLRGYVSSKDEENLNFKPDKRFSNFLKNIDKEDVMCFDKSGGIWYQIRDVGIYYLRNQQTDTVWKQVQGNFRSFGALNATVNTIFEDNHQNIWMGTFDRGVLFYSKVRKPFYHLQNTFNELGLINNNVRSVFQDSDGDIWIGSKLKGMLSKYDRNSGIFVHYKPDVNNPNALNDDMVFSINELKKGTLIVGTMRGGLSTFDKKTGKFKAYKADNKGLNSFILEDYILNVYPIDGKIWVGYFSKGLGVLDFKTMKSINFIPNNKNANSLPEARCRYIFKDSYHQIWVGTGEGLCMYNDEKQNFTRFTHKSEDSTSLVDNFINQIYEDAQHNLWICTNNGISKYIREKKQFISYNSNHGIASNIVVGIVDDNEGNLWLATSGGLTKFNPTTLKFRNYTIEDGLQSNEFSSYTSLKTKTGEVIFGGSNGFNIFNPAHIRENTNKTNVIFTDFKIFNKSVKFDEQEGILNKSISFTKEIELKWYHSVFSFEFVALNYLSPSKNQYAFRMKGFEKEWNYVGNKNEATYTNLDAGEYVFQVKAANNDGIWNEELSEIKITIYPPWWDTWWFRILVVVAVLGSIIRYFQYRAYQIKKKNEELEKLVNIRTSELQEANVNLMEQKEEILQQSEELQATAESLEKSNGEILKSYASLQLISDFGQKITASLELNKIYGDIYSYINSLMDADAFGVGKFNESKNIIEYEAFLENNIPKPYFFNNLDQENSFTVWCFKNQQAIFISNYFNEAHNYIEGEVNYQTSKQTISLIYIPLTIENRRVGVLTVQSYKQDAYTNNDLTNIKTIASYLAIAIDNSNAYETINRERLHIKTSINYAKTIQNAILPPKELMDSYFESFVIYNPKELVSGDFYWFSEYFGQGKLINTNNKEQADTIFVAVADCTGHSVPGAFMSLICSSLLTEVVKDQQIVDPKEILKMVHNKLYVSLNQALGKNNDGMDIALCKLTKHDEQGSYLVTFCGAKRPFVVFNHQSKRVLKLKGSARSIGGWHSHSSKSEFLNSEIIVSKGDVIYLFSDGIPDQNDFKRDKFGSGRLLDLLTEIAELPFAEQKKCIEERFNSFMENTEQRDDVTLLGLKV